MSSVIFCQEDHHGHGWSLVLDTITTQAFSLGFTLLILYLVCSIFPFDSSLADRNQSAYRYDPKSKQRILNAQSGECQKDTRIFIKRTQSLLHDKEI